MRKIRYFYRFFAVTALCIFLISFLIGAPVLQVRSSSAQSIDDLNAQLNSLLQQENQIQAKLKQDQQQSASLSGQIGQLQQKINDDRDVITQKQQLISVNQSQMDLLQKSIDAYITEIAALQNKLTSLQTLMSNRAKASYEDSYVSPVQLLLDNSDINAAITSVAYFDSTRKADMDLAASYTQSMDKLNKDNADLIFKKAQLQGVISQLQQEESSMQADQANLQKEQDQLVAQKQSVDSSLASDKNVLSSIQGQEANVESEKAYIESLRSSSGYAFPRCGNFGGYSDSSWYANQLCNPNWLVQTVGCLATDLSMLSKYYNGYFVDPSNYMDGNGYLVGYPTVNGNSPTVDGTFLGYGMSFSSVQGTVNSLLAQGRPVIAGMWPVWGGSHYVVLIKYLGGGNYLINNPAGSHPDETLNGDGFDTSLIHQIIYY